MRLRINILILVSIFHCTTSAKDGLLKNEVFRISFEQSMGCSDPYMKCYFTKSLKKAPFWWYTLSDFKPSEAFTFFKSIFNEQKKAAPYKKNQCIPKTVHQIWIGNKKMPEKYTMWQKTWQTLSGWDYKLWTDKEVEQYPMMCRKSYDLEKNIGAKVDILRMEILYNEGGLYVDLDFECLKPEYFTIFNDLFDFYTGLTPVDGKAYLLANGLIGVIPHHPIIKTYLDALENEKNISGDLGVMLRGPGLFTKTFFASHTKDYANMVLPASFFYPLGIYQASPSFLSSDENRENLKQKVVKHETVAIHWWEGSWHEDNKQKDI